MVEPGDTVSGTLKKEFGEEAMNSLEANPEQKKKIEEQINQLFSQGQEVRNDKCPGRHCVAVVSLVFSHSGFLTL